MFLRNRHSWLQYYKSLGDFKSFSHKIPKLRCSPLKPTMAKLFTRTKEQSQVILFFLHNFFISIGTVLVYVSANIILLENHPEFSLPIAYIFSTLAMMGVGKIYEYYEHHFLLQKLSSRVLLAVLILSLIMIGILFLSHSMITAIGIMVGFRVIYLLVNLEFWGVSAVVFDVRQSKKIFSVIGSGDVPAKAIGAILTVLIHSTSVLAILVSVAFVTFLLAFYTQKLTFQVTDIPVMQEQKTRKNVQSKYIQELFGGSRLVFEMCIGFMAVAASATWIEYNFFVNVKYKFHSQHDVISFVGYVLAITYSISTLIKLSLSSRVIDRFGLKNALLFLPIGTIIISAVLVILSSFRNDEASLLLDFSAAYLLFEVMRRTLFDPVFLVMFQPLSTHQRLKGHTLAKGFYEPLGMGIAGILLLAEYYFDFSFTWIEFGFTVLSAFVAFYFLGRAFEHYIIELKTALSKRFLRNDELVMQGDALKVILKNIESDRPEEVISAIDWIVKYQTQKLGKYVPKLLQNPSDKVRFRTLEVVNETNNFDSLALQKYDLEKEKNGSCRKLASQIICTNESLTEEMLSQYLNSKDINIAEGAIIGSFQSKKAMNIAKERLDRLCKSSNKGEIFVALDIIETLKLTTYEDYVKSCFQQNTCREKSVEVAGVLGTPTLIKFLVSLLSDRVFSKKALHSLLNLGENAFIEIKKLKNSDDQYLLRKIIVFCEKYKTEGSEKLLMDFVKTQPLDIRLLALKALSQFPNESGKSAFFEDILQKELKHAYQLLNGFGVLSEEVIQYELGQSTNRIFYLLMLIYDKETVQDAMLGVEHSSREKRANALEILDNIIPRNVYKCLHTLLDDTSIDKKIEIFEVYFDKKAKKTPIIPHILEKGESSFGDWTITQAIIKWQANKAEVALVEPYLTHPKKLFREAVSAIILKNKTLFEKSIALAEMNHSHETTSISELERVIVLKNTQLFAQTPENVLTSIVPIMREISIEEGKTIFKKGEIGHCMYVIYAGEISIYDHETLLATFTKGDVFGELALLDAEPRSASAVAENNVLLFRIDQEDFYDLMEERNELLRSVLRILCQRIRNQNDKIRSLT